MIRPFAIRSLDSSLTRPLPDPARPDEALLGFVYNAPRRAGDSGAVSLGETLKQCPTNAGGKLWEQ